MSTTITPIESPSAAPYTEDAFQKAVAEWMHEKGPSSNSARIAAHPAFRRIVAKGWEAVPFLLRELETRPSLLVLALSEITAENPVPRESRGKVKEMAKAWVEWGKKKGLVR
jgi:hypothetical protein